MCRYKAAVLRIACYLQVVVQMGHYRSKTHSRLNIGHLEVCRLVMSLIELLLKLPRGGQVIACSCKSAEINFHNLTA